MKARTFLDQLAESRVELGKGIDPTEERRDALERDSRRGTRITKSTAGPHPTRGFWPRQDEMERAEEELAG